MKWIIREKQRQESNYNAGSKARSDVENILIKMGFQVLDANLELDLSQSFFKKILLQFRRSNEWNTSVKHLKKGDIVVLQFPVRNHTVLLYKTIRSLNKKGVKVIGVVHDLESLRQSMVKSVRRISRLRYKLEEVYVLKYFSGIIVHNEYMKKAMHQLFGLPLEKMVSIRIFDYLYSGPEKEKDGKNNDSVIIAGNLDKRKSGYIYDLPTDVSFGLFGANYSSELDSADNITYYGKVDPDELPGILDGKFGLVWDGPSASTCEGVYGEYLKVNNPHKTSLYLASGIPVIVWKQSAIADFVRDRKCGIAVNRLGDIKEELDRLSNEEYVQMRVNAIAVGEELKAGSFTAAAVKEAVKRAVQ